LIRKGIAPVFMAITLLFKTTLYDAFFVVTVWQGQSNKSDFEIKPLDVSGNTVHHLNTEVEGSFNLSDKIVTLKKKLLRKMD